MILEVGAPPRRSYRRCRLRFTDEGDEYDLGLRSNYKGRAGKSELPVFLNTSKFLQAEAGTLGTNSALVSEATGASPLGGTNNVVETTFGTSNNLTVDRISYASISSTRENSLRGAWDVFARVRTTTGTVDLYVADVVVAAERRL